MEGNIVFEYIYNYIILTVHNTVSYHLKNAIHEVNIVYITIIMSNSLKTARSVFKAAKVYTMSIFRYMLDTSVFFVGDDNII